MNASAVNSAAAVAAALQEDMPGVSKRRSLNLKSMGNNRGLDAGKHAGSNQDRYLPNEGFKSDNHVVEDDESAVVDDLMSTESLGSMSKSKARRASEGSYLIKGEGKRSSSELRCEKCGKGYKHSSCLTKHLSVISGPFVLQLSALLLPQILMQSPLDIDPWSFSFCFSCSEDIGLTYD